MGKIKFIPQIMQTECGLCCITMIERYYGNFITLNELRNFLQPGRDGVTLRQLCDIIDWTGFEFKIYKGASDSFTQLSMPFIAYWNKSHYIIIEKVKNGFIHVIDPAVGRVVYSKEDFDEKFSNIILTLKPKDNMVLRKKEKSVWTSYLPLISKNKLPIAMILLLSLLMYGISLFIPTLMRVIIDSITNLSIKIVFISLFFVIGYMIIALSDSIIKALFRAKFFQDFTEDVFCRLTKVPYSFFDIRVPSGLNFNFRCIYIIRDTYAEKLINFFISIGAVLVLMGYIIYLSPLIFACILVLFILIWAILNVVGKYVVLYNQLEISSKSKLESIQYEFFYSILPVKIAGYERKMYENWKGQFKYANEKTRQKEIYQGYYNTIISTTQIMLPIIILFVGAIMSRYDNLSVGTLISIYSITSMCAVYFMNIVLSTNYFELSSQYLERIKDIVAEKTEDEGEIIVEKIDSVKLDNISFKYNKYAPLALKNVSMVFEKGKKIAIVGGSGSGKSTIAKILLGLYTPTEGNVLYNNIDLKNINKEILKKHIGMVPQDSILLNKSIIENISMNREGITVDQVVAACEMANIREDIERMPMKYNTLLNDIGTNVSGGQRQRIVMARALAGRPEVIIFDEATSSLDSINESIIFEKLKDYSCTRIVIAHRLSTVEDADIIYVMNQGEVVEQGSHNELIEKNGVYKRLYLNS